MTTPRVISASTLRGWMDTRPDSIAIVDVRDDDRIGGHIRGSINVPASKFYGAVAKLQTALNGRTKVIFHCQLSQQRGPSCANVYTRQLAAKGIRNQEVFVLQGGFNEWARAYGRDQRYTEKFCPDLYR